MALSTCHLVLAAEISGDIRCGKCAQSCCVQASKLRECRRRDGHDRGRVCSTPPTGWVNISRFLAPTSLNDLPLSSGLYTRLITPTSGLGVSKVAETAESTSPVLILKLKTISEAHHAPVGRQGIVFND